MSEKANINPSVLKWARETAKISLETSAHHLSIDASKVEKWENGELQPTIKQAEKLAKFYKRPFSAFFLPVIPTDFHILQDYRNANAKPLSTASVFIIREIQQKQLWLREASIEFGEPKLPFIGKFTSKDSPEIVAKDILTTLEINPEEYEENNILKIWIRNAEKKGICISRTSFIHSRMTLNPDEFQGFSISDEYAPFIFINSKDWSAPQLFTLVHELAHLWISETGISSDIEFGITKDKNLHPVEMFCNQVAAHALLPDSLMEKLDPACFQSSRDIFKNAKKYGISSKMLLVRAYNLKTISLKEYKNMKERLDKKFKEFLQQEDEKKKKKGGPNPHLLKLNKNGKLFTQIVLDYYRSGTIQAVEASNLLDSKISNFSKLEELLYK